MNIFIIGCGRVGSQLGKMFSVEGHDVVIIDTDPDAFKRLGSAFNGLQVVGSGTDEILLREAKIEEADVFIALTDKDNINIMAAQIARSIFQISKAIAKVDDPARDKAFQEQDFTIVSGTHLVSDAIWNQLSQKPYKRCCNISPDTGIIRFTPAKTMVGKSVAQLNVGTEFMVCGVVRQGRCQVALPDQEISSTDELVAIAKTRFLGQLEKILEA